MKKLFLIDAYALIFRSYYAFIGRPMRNSKGLNTSAIFGFAKFLAELIHREKPHYLGVAFDPKGGNFRHEMYPEYKANRSETPEDIVTSVPYIKQLLTAMRIPVLEVPGFEADDVIGTLSAKGAAEGFEVYMVTPDKDFGQLIAPNVYIYKQRKGEGIDIVGTADLCANYGIENPRQVIDILALWGDASDNIPGVPGIGEKGAAKLVREFGSVENIIANSDKLSPKQREAVEATKEQIMLSKELATISLNVPIAFEPECLVMEEPDTKALYEIYQELGFSSFLRTLGNASQGVASQAGNAQAVAGKTAPAKPSAPKPRDYMKCVEAVQGDLFSAPGAPGASTSAADITGSEDETDDNGQGISSSPLIGGAPDDLFSFSEFSTAADTPHEYTTLRTAEEVAALAKELSGHKMVCFDTETTGFDPFSSLIVGISFAVREHEAWYVACDNSNRKEILDLLRPMFEDESIAKIGQNLKFDIMILREAGVRVRGRLYDTMIVHYLIDPEARHDMNSLSRKYLGYRPITIEELIGRGAKQITMDMVPVDKAAEYGAEDADVTFRLYGALWPLLKELSMEELYTDIEEPLINILSDIELTGVRLDTTELSRNGDHIRGELVDLESRIREATGIPDLNINSPKQLGEALFEKLRIAEKPKMTKTKQYKTDEESLQGLADRHPVVGLILEYRGLKKLLSTYIDALPLLVNPKTGRIHTSFNQAVTSTGRLSSTNPNLQNIPIRDQLGRELRRAFVPSDSDHLLLSVDYSQVELRLMAHLSGDISLIEAFEKGEDIHTATAAKIFGISEKEVTPQQRRAAKTANFGIIYGISAFGLSQRLAIPVPEAKAIIEGYFASYPGVKEYMDNVIALAREQGYVSTLFGRRRYLPDIRSGNAVVRGLSERNAINAPIQGGAADIMKIAMRKVHDALEKGDFKSKIILQVHDELVLDLYKPEEEKVTKLVVENMEAAATLKVKLIAESGVGSNWMEAH